MAKPAPKAETIKKSDKRWQSDVIVDMIDLQDRVDAANRAAA